MIVGVLDPKSDDRRRTILRSLCVNCPTALRVPLAASTALLFFLASMAGPAASLEPVVVSQDTARIELNPMAEIYDKTSDVFEISTPPNAAGIVFRRLSVRAQMDGKNQKWFVFELKNDTTESIERWLAPEPGAAAVSGVKPAGRPVRMVAVTPSIGSMLERIGGYQTDVFRLVIPAGRSVTYVVELSGSQPLPIFLWTPSAYAQTVGPR
jgi:hypothetical protein